MSTAVASSARPVAAPAVISRGKRKYGKRVVIYGGGGVGKTTLSSFAPNPVLMDFEAPFTNPDLEYLDVARDWMSVRATCQDFQLLEPFETIVLDSGSRLEKMSMQWCIENIPHEKGKPIARSEDWGFGKGFQHNFDTFITLLGDFDRLVERGKNIVLICHEIISNFPNPDGEDYIGFVPRLQPGGPKGLASIRNEVFEWADTVAYIGQDSSVKDGKAKGWGTRTIYFERRPTWLAKTRNKRIPPLPWNPNREGILTDSDFWTKVLS